MTIVHNMGDAIPPPSKKPYVLELQLADGETLTAIILPSFEVLRKKDFRDRYWESQKTHSELAAACKAGRAPLPNRFLVFNRDNIIVAMGAYEAEDTPNDRAFIDVAILEIFLCEHRFQTHIGMPLDGVLNAEQQQALREATGADYIGRTPADTLH